MSIRANVLLWAQRTIARKGSPPHVLLEVGEQATAEQIQEAFHKIARTSHPDLHRTGLDGDELELVTSAYATVAGAYQQMRIACRQTTRIPVNPATQQTTRMPVQSAAPQTTRMPVQSAAPQTTRMPAQPAAPRTTTTTTPSGGSRTAAQTPPAGSHTVQPRPSSEPGVQRRRESSDPIPRTRVTSEIGMPRLPRPGTDSDSPVPATPSGAAPSANAAQAMSAKALLYYRKAELCLKRGDLRGAVLQLKLACAADPTSGFLRTALAEVEMEVRKSP
jgi:hypothetical protein